MSMFSGTQTPHFFSNSTLLIFSVVTLISVGILSITVFPVQAQAPSQGQSVVGFFANLSGEQQVPPNSINATGLAVFLFANESSELSYLVNTSGLEKITESHIYNGSADIKGEAVAPLSNEESAKGKNTTSIMFEGVVEENDLTGQLEGNKTTDLVSLMSNESSYVNIHTDQYEDGAIRGQIVMAQIQTNGNAITGLAIPGGLIGLSGISLSGGSITFSPGGGIIGFLPIPIPGSGTQGPGGIVTEGGTIVHETVNTLGGTVDNTVKTVGDTAKAATDTVDNTVEKIDDGIVQRLLDNDDDDDSRDNDDDDDSRDNDDDDGGDDDDDGGDDDDDGGDDDDDGGDDDDSVKDKVDRLLD